MSAAAEEDPFQRLFPPNSIVHVNLEISRVKKVFQHEDNARPTSCFVEGFFANASDVSGGWLEPGDAATDAEKEISASPRRGQPVAVPKFSAVAPAAAASEDGAVIFQTKTVNETADPFINDVVELVFTPTQAVASPEQALARFHLRVVDSNFDPARPVGRATLEFNFAKSGKGECTLAMPLDPQLAAMAAATDRRDRLPLVAAANDQWPSVEVCKDGESVGGSLVVRWAIKITKPKPPVRDPDADVEVPLPEKLSGSTLLVDMPFMAPAARTGAAAADEDEEASPQPAGPHALMPGLVLFTDQDFTTKFNKALIKVLGAVYDEDLAAKSPSRRRGGGAPGGGMGNSRRGATPGTPAEEEATLDKVVLKYWQCKRSHQVMTKVRVAAEHCFKGVPHLGFTSEEEMSCKLQWKKNAALLQVGVTGPQVGNLSSGLRLMYDKLWVMVCSGDDETETGSLWTPNLEQRTKLQFIAWGPTQYVALQAAFIKLVLPALSDQEALTIGLEDFKADDATLEAMTPQPGSSRVIGQNPNNAAPAASASLGGASTSSPGAASRRGGASGGGAASTADTPHQAALRELEKAYAPARGDQAFKIFVKQTSEFVHRWAGTMTETEQIALVKGTSHVIPFVRFHAGLITEKPRAARNRSASRRAAASRRA